MLSGCESFLEEIPESQLSPEGFFNSEDNVEIAVNGIYDVLGNRGFGVGLNFGNYNQGLFFMGCSGTDHFRSPADNNTGNRFHLLDVFAHTASSQIPSNVWIVHYIGINRANSVIANTEPLLDNPNFDSDRLNSLIAEAKFLRAFFYFNLVRFYGDVPIKLTQTASLTAEDVVAISRSPITEVYDQIEEDLLFAEQYLRTAGELVDNVEHGRATVTAAQAALARLYLTWAGYPLKDTSKWNMATDYANRVITSGEHSLMSNFQDVFTLENEGNDELIFVAKFSYVLPENTSLGATNGIVGAGTNGAVAGISASYGQIRAEQMYWASFEDGDLRRDWTISDFRVNSSGDVLPLTDAQKANPLTNTFGFAKFRRDGSYVAFESPYDYPLYRYADILLMYAESTANEAGGPTSASYDAINQVRRRAYGLNPNVADPNVDLSGLTSEEFQNAIMDERSWELSGEDCLRWHDLVRWEKLGEIVTTRKRASVQTLFNEDKHKLFPIPIQELDANPLINQDDQNPGY